MAPITAGAPCCFLRLRNAAASLQPRGWLTNRLLPVILLAVLVIASPAWADEGSNGAELFSQHCAGCHIHGGNIIRRGKTLKLAALQRQGLDSEEAIATIAAEGIGQMSGYRQVLGEAGVEAVASWVWEQAQNAWIQG